jgi:NAD(P)-dependent dehydrogenase (short-subunit alcohol dehydrogenase family)
VNYNRSENEAKNVVNEIRRLGTKASAVKADVSKATEVKNLVEKTLKEFGRINILVNNAGIESLNKMVDITEEEWDHTMNTNAKGELLENKQPQKQQQQQRQQSNVGVDANVIRDIVRETVQDVLRENGLLTESETKSNEVFKFRVGQHIFEGKLIRVKKIAK